MILWISQLPKDNVAAPNKIKIGDVFMHTYFRHPVVVLRIRKGLCICCSLSHNPERCMLEAAETRFFSNNYFTTNIVILPIEELIMHMFMGIFDNHRQLQRVFRKLTNIVK